MKRYARYIVAATLLCSVRSAESNRPRPAVNEKTVVSAYRIFAKSGHESDLERGLAAHVKKYHKGDWAWRISQVLSGPDSEAFEIAEGPMSWTALDQRGNLGPEHRKDWLENVVPHIERTLPDNYAVYVAALSTVALTEWSDKVLVRHFTIKPGHETGAREILKAWKAVFGDHGMNVVVSRSAWSGVDGYHVAIRLKHGWKDLEAEIPDLDHALETKWGPSEAARLRQATRDDIAGISDEMLLYKPELSSD